MLCKLCAFITLINAFFGVYTEGVSIESTGTIVVVTSTGSTVSISSVSGDSISPTQTLRSLPSETPSNTIHSSYQAGITTLQVSPTRTSNIPQSSSTTGGRRNTYLGAIRAANGTYLTNCPHQVAVVEWTNYQRIDDLSRLTGNEIFTMDVMRRTRKTRYYTGTLTVKMMMQDGQFAGYIRTTSMPGKPSRRFFFIPKIIRDGKCTYSIVNDPVEAIARTGANSYRSWKMFLQPLNATHKLISYDNVNFNEDDENDSGFLSARLLPPFFKAATQQHQTPSEVLLWRRLAREANQQGRRRRRRSISTSTGFRGVAVATTSTCNRWLSGSKFYSSITYFVNRPGPSHYKVYTICRDMLATDATCAGIKQKYPGHLGCTITSSRCGYHPGTGDQSESASNEDHGYAAKIDAGLTDMRGKCALIDLNLNMLSLQRNFISNDIELNKQSGELARQINGALLSIGGLLADHASDTLRTSDNFVITNGNIVGLGRLITGLRNDLDKAQADGLDTSKLLTAALAEIQKIRDAELKTMSAQIRYNTDFNKKVGKVLHIEYDDHYNSTAKHDDLDDLLEKSKNHTKDLDRRSHQRHNDTNVRLDGLDLGYTNQSDKIAANDRNLKANNKTIDGIKKNADNLKKQQDENKNATAAWKKRETERRAKAADALNARKGNANPFGAHVSPAGALVAGLAVSSAGGFLMIIVIVMIACCISKNKD